MFLKLLTLKDVLTYMHKSYCFWKHSRSERLNESQKLLKSAEKYFYPTSASFWAKLSYKKSFLVKSDILGLLVNTLTTDYQYSRSNRENLPLPMQRQLFKNFFSIFYRIFGMYIKFGTFWKKMSLIAQVFLKLLTLKDVLT